MNKAELQQIRDALAKGNGWAGQALADHDEKYDGHPALEESRAIITESQGRIAEAIAILDAELAKPEPEPYEIFVLPAYVDDAPDAHRVKMKVGVQQFTIGMDYWETKAEAESYASCFLNVIRKITAPHAAKPVPLEMVYDKIIEWSTAGKGSRRELARRMIELFTAPPSRKWQSLTDEERHKWIDAVVAPSKACARDYQVSLITEAALRKKNSGEQA